MWSFSSPVVGLDIQQKFNVYYSGARRFGTSHPHVSYEPQSTEPTLREDATSATDQGTKFCTNDLIDAKIWNRDKYVISSMPD